MRTNFLILIFLFSRTLLFGQLTIPNSTFEQNDNSSDTKSSYWKIGGNPALCSLDSTNVWKGKYSMHIVKNTVDGYASFAQEIPFNGTGLKKYKIIGAIRTKDVKDKYAGVFAKVTDKNGNVICRQDMGALKINNTNDWKIYSAEFYADETAVRIKVAGLLYGSGEVWFDDFTIEEIPLSSKTVSPNIDKYIDEYFKIVHDNSLVEDTTYINNLKEKAKLLCAGDSTLAYCHSVLKNYITPKLNDGHSFFQTPQEMNDWKTGDKTTEAGLANFASGKMIDNNIAFINVPTFVSLDSILIRKYVDSLQTIIATLDNKNPKGWIIDVSSNMGGNSWAMISGLGAILGNGTFGYSISANGNKMTRIYNEGWAGWDTILMFKKVNPYHLKNVKLPIAIIYGNATASSGEVVAIAFRGMKNTKSFGQETNGSTTRVDNFELSDGAYLNLASGVDADRNGVLFGGKITPNQITKDNDTALSEAVKWIIQRTKRE
jgi:carboxyl-terminal processing protease